MAPKKRHRPAGDEAGGAAVELGVSVFLEFLEWVSFELFGDLELDGACVVVQELAEGAGRVEDQDGEVLGGEEGWRGSVAAEGAVEDRMSGVECEADGAEGGASEGDDEELGAASTSWGAEAVVVEVIAAPRTRRGGCG